MRTLQILLLTLFVSGTTLNSFSQITGYALLDGQADNSGIKVKFHPNSPSATLDSATTNFNGDYSMILSPGIYNISLNKYGFQEKFYDNGNSIIITGNEILDSITLYAGIVQNISGNVSGLFYNSITYVIDGDINIPVGNSLTIQPGTQIKFSGNYNINVYGELISIGTGSSPILISSNNSNPQPNDWGFINFFTGSSNNSEISNCIIEYGNINCEYVDINITNNIIRYFENRGIYERNSTSYIANNEIYNFYGAGTDGMGIISQFSSSIIECNHIYNGTGRGILAWGGNQIVQNNKVHNLSGNEGIDIGGPDGDAIVQNNIVYNCDKGISVNDWYSESTKPNPTIINNTIYNNTIGIYSGGAGQYGSGVIKMNILYNNITGMSGVTNNQPSDISYNIFWGSTTDFIGINIIGIGQIVTTNINGDPSDSYYNLFMDPLLDLGNMPFLLANSPTIDAGLDDSGTIKDIGVDLTTTGCNDLTTYVKYNSIEEDNINIYPNPASYQLMIDTELSINEIKIIDLTGKQIKIIKPFTSLISVTDIPSGIYFIQLTTDEGVVIEKLVIQ